jgi:hypothetical protein
MPGHIAIRQKTIFGFDQHFSGRAYQDGAERMVAVATRALSHGERSTQERFVIRSRQRIRPRFQSAAPNLAVIAAKMRSGLNGMAQNLMPVASARAFPMAAAIGLYGLSLIGLAPNGPTVS